MEVSARLSSKGQVTVPRAVREALSLEEGDRLLFRVEGDHAVLARTPGSPLAGGICERARGQAGHALGEGPAPDAAGPGRRAPVTAFVDTNILVRHFTGDPPDLAVRATRYLGAADELLLPDLILAEVAYVLESFYEAPRAQVATALRAMLAFPAIRVLDADLLQRAVEVYEVHRLDFADAYLVASAERTGIGVVASFDRAINRVTTIRREEPS